MLRSVELVGATLMMIIDGRKLAVTIAAVEEDRQASGGRLMLHRFRVRQDDGRIDDLCLPDATNEAWGFPIPDGRGGFELTCMSGAYGKCVRLGYRPWEERPGGPPLSALHRACMRMIRADYGGDGTSWTRDGTLIDVYDRFGVQSPQQTGEMSFEAGWSETGAVCVAHPRLRATPKLAELARRYPDLAGRTGPQACDEKKALPEALLFNRSAE